MNERPDPSPEGRLISEALRRLQPKMSQREAARSAGISEARWRQIVSGYQMVSGQPIPVTAPADTVARMAQVVHLTPEQLEESGRTDAASELRELPPPPDPTGAEPSITELAETVSTLKQQVADLRARLERLDDSSTEGRQRDFG